MASAQQPRGGLQLYMYVAAARLDATQSLIHAFVPSSLCTMGTVRLSRMRLPFPALSAPLLPWTEVLLFIRVVGMCYMAGMHQDNLRCRLQALVSLSMRVLEKLVESYNQLCQSAVLFVEWNKQ